MLAGVVADVVAVSDPEDRLRVLARELVPDAGRWRVLWCARSTTLYEQLRQRPPAVLLVRFDLSAPYAERAANEELAQLAAASPNSIRLALVDRPCELINAHQCLAIAMATEQLLPLLDGAVRSFERTRKHESLRRLLANMKALPTPPTIYFDLREQLSREQGSFRSMAEVVAKDINLVARVLRLANSGFYGLPRQVKELSEAIGLLGGDTVLGLILAVQLYSGLPPPGFRLDRLWEHAQWVANMAKKIVRLQKGDTQAQSLAMVAGLLHDIGLVALMTQDPMRYQPIWQSSGGDEHRLTELERGEWGISHNEFGALILSLWSLPDALVTAVEASHFAPKVVAEPNPNLMDQLTAKAVCAAEWMSQGNVAQEVAWPPTLADLDCVAQKWQHARRDLLAGR